MLKHLTVPELTGLVKNGASLVLDGNQFGIDQLTGIVMRLQPNAHIKIVGCDKFSVAQLNSLVARMPGQIIFE